MIHNVEKILKRRFSKENYKHTLSSEVWTAQRRRHPRRTGCCRRPACGLQVRSRRTPSASVSRTSSDIAALLASCLTSQQQPCQKEKTFINYKWRFTAAGAHRSKPQSDRFIYRPLTVQNHKTTTMILIKRNRRTNSQLTQA